MPVDMIPAKNIVSNYSAHNSWFGCNYNMNIYKGCCHGCIYCDSRSDCYRVDNFDRVKAKANALEIIRNDLRSKKRKGVIGTGAMSDPYNPFEKELKLTRHALELINAYGFGVAVATKSTLIARDIDVLKDIREHSPVLCKITITADNDELCGKIEPNAPKSSERFETIKRLSDAGIFTGVLLMPVLPFITDNEENILSIIEKARACGARFIYAAFGMTLRGNQREYYYDWLDEQIPGLKEKYISRYGERYNCTSPKARKLWSVFTKACERYGLIYKMHDIIRSYTLEYNDGQLSMF